jgi:hypothetical protein
MVGTTERGRRRNISGTIFLDARSSLATPVARTSQVCTFTPAPFFSIPREREITGDVNVCALLQGGREFGDLTPARDAMPVVVGLPIALAVFPRGPNQVDKPIERLYSRYTMNHQGTMTPRYQESPLLVNFNSALIKQGMQRIAL